MRKLTIALFAILFVLSAATVILAQGFDGTLRGDVHDPNGLAIANAKVTIRNEGTGEERATTTSSVGTFEAPHLLVGFYTVTVELEGFKKYVRKGVEVKQNQVTEVAIGMEIGAVTTVIEVTASGELVQTTTSNLASTWDFRVVSELPVTSLAINPDPQNLAVLLPGTTTQSGGVAGVGGAIGGNRPRDNSFVLDGVDNNRIDITGPSQFVIPEAVGELTILTNQFSAEYGHSTAGQFIMTTKSGTNDLHGSGFWYNNNRAYNSVDNITKAGILSGSLSGKPRFDVNRAGGTIGGPIIKDHWFIFGAYQYSTQGLASIPSSTINVPTAAGIAALQSLAATPGSGVSPIMLKIITDAAPVAPVAGKIVQKVTNNVTGTTVDIPTGGIAPSAPNFLAQHDFAISSDVQTAKHRFSTRVLYDRQRSPDVGALPVPLFTGSSGYDSRSVTFSDVYAVTPHVVNEFRTGYRRQVGPNLIVPALTPPGKLDVYPDFILPALNLELGPDGCSPQSTTINIYEWSNNLSIAKGAHTLKTGVQAMLWISPVNFLARERAEYRYAPSNNFASALDNFVHDGIPALLVLRGIGNGNFSSNEKGFYTFFQDDWKATRKLTLNLGLRYEYTTNPRALQLQLQNSISDDPNPTPFATGGATPATLRPLFFSHLPGTDTNNFGPRIGFAYDVFGDHKTAIRGGFAVAYDVIFNNFYTANALSPNLQVEEDPTIACGRTSPPAYCSAGVPNPLGPFVANGGLPPAGGTVTLTQAQARAGTSTIVFDVVDPKVLTWSLGVQHEFGKDWAAEVRYVGTRGISLPVQIRLNARPVAPESAFLPTFVKGSDVPATLPAASSVPGTGTPNLANFLTFSAKKNYQLDGFKGNITSFLPQGQSVYHGASIDVTRRLTGLGRWSHGAFLKANYTYSKEIDNATNEFFTSVINPRRPQDFNNLSADRAPGPIDHTQKFALAAIYEVPWYNGSSAILRGLTNGWQISASYIAETGQPVTLVNFINTNGNGDGAADRALFNPAFTVLNSTSDVNVVCRNNTTGATFIATSVGGIDSTGATSGCDVGQAGLTPPPFNKDGSPATTPANQFAYGYVAACAPGEVKCTKNPNAEFITGQVGSNKIGNTVSQVGRDTARSAGINNWNLAFLKKTHITEQKYVEFRASLVNAFNHRQPILGYGSIEQNPVASTANAVVGASLVQVTDPNNLFLQPLNNFSTGGAAAPYQRIITFGLRLVF